MRFFKFTAVISPDIEDKFGYNVSVPAFPEIATCGDSLEEARYMAQDALELVILSCLEDGEVIPQDIKPKKVIKNSIVEEIIVSVAHDVTATPASYVKTALFQGA